MIVSDVFILHLIMVHLCHQVTIIGMPLVLKIQLFET